MDFAQLATLLLTSSVIGGIATKTLDWIRDARAGHLERRRAEVDKAIKERDTARAERDQALRDLAVEKTARTADVAWWERWARILEEALALARRRFIDAPGTDPDELDPYPPRPSRDKP